MEAFDTLLTSDILAFLVFSLFSLTSLGGALYVLLTKNLLYGAYGFLVSLIGVAGLFLLASAEFIAVSQIMIYVGGVLVLILFGIMLSAKGRNKNQALAVSNSRKVWSLVFALGITIALGLMAANLMPASAELQSESGNTIRGLGMELMTTQVLILELIGILLLVVLIGASYIAKPTEP